MCLSSFFTKDLPTLNECWHIYANQGMNQHKQESHELKIPRTRSTFKWMHEWVNIMCLVGSSDSWLHVQFLLSLFLLYLFVFRWVHIPRQRSFDSMKNWKGSLQTLGHLVEKSGTSNAEAVSGWHQNVALRIDSWSVHTICRYSHIDIQ